MFGGLDLSSRQDLTALVLVARDSSGLVHMQPHFWAPAQGLRERAQRDRAPYDLWRDRGLLTATPGARPSTMVCRRVPGQSGHPLRSAGGPVRSLADQRSGTGARAASGPKMRLEPNGQGVQGHERRPDQFEALALNGRLRHGMHPLLTWCAANAVITKDAAGNRKIDRSRATGRVDGMVAAVMAVAAMSGAPEPAVPQYQIFFLS